jgi:hypothetical protein
VSEKIPTAATGANRFITKLSLPKPAADMEQTAFSNMRWRMGLLHGANSTQLYQTENGRHWAAVEGIIEPDSQKSMMFTTYAGVSTNAAALLFDGVHPARSASWQKHNVTEAPAMTSAGFATIMHICAAMAIMSRRGAIGTEDKALRTARKVHSYPRIYSDSRSALFASAQHPDNGLVLTTTSHLRHDTTSIRSMLVPSAAEAERIRNPDIPPDPEIRARPDIDMSMYGHPTPTTTAYLERLLASAVYVINDNL